MPATETLLRKLKETLGEEATSDLVTWVDHAAARDIAQLRELAGLHYGRFDARLEQRLAELKAELRLDQGLAQLRAELRLDQASLRADLKAETNAIRQDLTRLEAHFDARLGAVRSETASHLDTGLGALRLEMASHRADLMKWMFIYSAGTVLPLGGLIIALFKL